jgi:hypothetical protein
LLLHNVGKPSTGSWSCRKLGSVLGLSKDVGVRQRADLMPRKCKKCWVELPYT